MNKNKGTDLHQALIARDFKKVKELLSSRADVDALDREGRTPLFYAVAEGEFEIASQLIMNGANTNARDREGETPLHVAAREYRPELIRLLLANSADVDAQDKHGNTPLFRAVFESRGRGGAIKVLLAAGADRKRKNKYSVSPEELANTIANYDVKQYLEAENCGKRVRE